jgi:hypothetical protein
MRRGNIFWGVILIVLGVLFFLQTSGIISGVFGWFWPIFLMLLGVWILMGRMMPQWHGSASDETFSIDLQGAAQVSLDFDQGAGSVQVVGGAPVGVAVTGTQATGMDIKSHLSGDRLEVKIDAGPSFIPFLGPESGVWRFQLNQDVPLTLDVDAGASSLDFDLTDLKVTSIKVDMGASTLKMKLPANAGMTVVDIDAGAATVDLSVPQGVGARLRLEQGASTVDVDQSRFVMQSSNFYQSADYDTAANKVEIKLDGGANTIKVR